MKDRIERKLKDVRMDNTIKINHLIAQIMKLDKRTRDGLINQISRLLAENNRNDKDSGVKISDLEGLGAGIWKNIDIDLYIRRERQWD